jgi:hypothetical protein
MSANSTAAWVVSAAIKVAFDVSPVPIALIGRLTLSLGLLETWAGPGESNIAISGLGFVGGQSTSVFKEVAEPKAIVASL